MPPRSPTLAFDPTPALAHNHFSPLNGTLPHNSMDNYHYGDRNGKEVRFEAPAYTSTNVHGRHSIATSNVPLLPPVSSASHIPKQSFQITNPSQGVNITAYFEQCRNVNEQLRKAHEQDRNAWEIERTALKTRIADLEFQLNKASNGRRRLSNENSRSFNGDFAVHPIPGMTPLAKQRHQSNTVSNAPLEHLKHEHSKPIWEPASPVPATRVFSHDDDVQHLPSISEDGVSIALSPQTSHENKPIPIQEIDETLDGITVKSEGVKSSFVKIMSPIILASPGRSPSPKQITGEPPGLRLDHTSLLDPLDAKLKKNAGHTPLAFDGSLSSNATTGGPTPREEKPPAPAPTARPPLRPSERSDSYFSTNDIHATIHEEAEPDEPEPQFEPAEDKPLSGPLMLDHSGDTAASRIFLEQLDHKLDEEVRKSLSTTPEHSPVPTSQSKKTDDDTIPTLKMKKSTNFGSAYGTSMPGMCDRA